MTEPYILVTRTQYTFNATDEQIACLLTMNVKANNNPSIVNVVGLFTLRTQQYENIVKIVVGTDNPNTSSAGGGGDPLNPDPLRTNDLQNKQFVKNLKSLKIEYTTQNVIQILNVDTIIGTAGIYRIFITALSCVCIPIYAFYSGESIIQLPLVTCNCDDNTTVYKKSAVCVFIEVPINMVGKAINVIQNINTNTPFNENQLCINRINVENKCVRKCNNKCNNKCDNKCNNNCKCKYCCDVSYDCCN